MIKRRYLYKLVFTLQLITGMALSLPVAGSITGLAASVQTGVVPAGTVLALRMETHLSSKSSRVGDPFTAIVTRAVTVRNRIVIPAGSEVEGHVTAVQRAKRMSRSGTIAIAFDRLMLPRGRSYRIIGELTSLDAGEQSKIEDESRISGGSTKKRSIVFIGGGAGAGAIIGAVSGGGKGAAVGTGVGAALGAAGALLSKGHEAEVRSGTEFGMELVERLDLSQLHTRARRADLSSRMMIRRAQKLLADDGYYQGLVDGLLGPQTRRALRDFQRDNHLPVTGRLDKATARELGLI